MVGLNSAKAEFGRPTLQLTPRVLISSLLAINVVLVAPCQFGDLLCEYEFAQKSLRRV